MTKDEALHLALEALKTKSFDLHSEWGGPFNGETKLKQLQDKAITAIKAALEAKNEKPLCYAAMFDKWFLAKSGLDPNTPLYTTPPQRTWVGLTDEDISEIVRGTHNTGSFVRAIEAKLKELNT